MNWAKWSHPGFRLPIKATPLLPRPLGLSLTVYVPTLRPSLLLFRRYSASTSVLGDVNANAKAVRLTRRLRTHSTTNVCLSSATEKSGCITHIPSRSPRSFFFVFLYIFSCSLFYAFFILVVQNRGRGYRWNLAQARWLFSQLSLNYIIGRKPALRTYNRVKINRAVLAFFLTPTY